MTGFNEKLSKKIANCGISYPDIFRKLPSDMSEYMDYFGLPYNNIEYEGGFVSIGNHKIFVQSYMSPSYEKTAFLFHGLFDHGAYFASLIPSLIKLKYRVVLFDQMGFGFSSGDRGYCDSFDQYSEIAARLIEKYHSDPNEPCLYIGHSAGCSSILNLIRNQKVSQNDKVIFLGPLVRCAKWGLVKFSYKIFNKFRDKVPRKYTRMSEDTLFVDKLKGDPLEGKYVDVRWVGALINWESTLSKFPTPILPVLVIQGDQDETVDWQYNLNWLSSKFSNLEKLIIEGGRHHIHNDGPKYKSICLQKIEKYLSN